MKKSINMLSKFYLILLIVGFISSCDNDDNLNMANQNNTPPSSFSLINLPDGSANTDLTQLTFSWESAIDIDGDPVVYEVQFGTDPSNLGSALVEITTDTSMILTDRANTCTTYYWRVIARDDKGGETESNNIFSFTTRPININSNPIIDDASFAKRSRHKTIIYDDRLWLIAGTTKDGVTNNFIRYNDVYSTLDGFNWEEMTNEAQFSKRFGHASVSFNNKMWVIGGNDGTPKNDVWSSTDGFNWTLETANANFTAMNHPKAIVFESKIWLFQNSEVWNTSNGVNWVLVNPQAGFMPREGYSVSVFKDEIWLIAGRSSLEDLKNDVWKSSDGINWIQITDNASFSPRFHHSTTVFDDYLYVIGGQEQPIIGETNDIWKSKDGAIWTLVTNNGFFEERVFHTSITYDDKLWVIAGSESLFDGAGFNDVWVMD
ncbi:hypothetical protein [Winogradskyella sp.]|uniref:hypothetical protein n=1 Tax=Winogradskyella sp. TaxID=1883156 RepID=UPI002601AC32|nr:hypothetical protein [Winogradskyella sp.]